MAVAYLIIECLALRYVLHLVGTTAVSTAEGSSELGSFCVGSANTSKCYRVIDPKRQYTWTEALEKCQQLGGDLPKIKTVSEGNTVLRLVKHWQTSKLCVGLTFRRARVVSNLYALTLMWNDDTVNYYFSYYGSSIQSRSCVFTLETMIHRDECCEFTVDLCSERCSLVCESENQRESQGPQEEIQIPNLTNDNESAAVSMHQRFVTATCDNGQVIHSFLSCDPARPCAPLQGQSQCVFEDSDKTPSDDSSPSDQSKNPERVYKVENFVCGTGSQRPVTIPYTLVCDFRSDCEGEEDEDFCVHPLECRGFRCRNGQCISRTLEGDSIHDCIDGSDEDSELLNPGKGGLNRKWNTTNVITFDGRGSFTTNPISREDACPQTHFRCPGEVGDCLPVYVRCNGVYDCPGREDEMGCDRYACPGFYRCRDSSVCVHVNHTCDGWPQCPKRDDELLCGVTCPYSCRCQGLAFVCHQPFPTGDFEDLRYLDAAGSGVTTGDVKNMRYLVWLSLKSSNLSSLSRMTLPNLRTLDLSDNVLSFVQLDDIVGLTNLRVITLAGNPLVLLSSRQSSTGQMLLDRVDLSHTDLTTFDGKVFSNFYTLSSLNLSFSKVDTQLASDAFSSIKSLTEIDLRGCPAGQSPSRLLIDLPHLTVVYADDYKLCCEAALPENFDMSGCNAPVDEVSSCEDLLRSDTYRVFLWLIGTISLVGNTGSFVVRMFTQKASSNSGFQVFVTNLSISDLIMGVYLAVVGAVDQKYRGNYLWFDKEWRESLICNVAGFLSLLSSEVSAMIICLITLDRFIVLRFPFSSTRFKTRSARVACVVVWSLGGLIAAIPLLPVTSHWEFYSQTGICIPLPITRRRFAGQHYAFGVMIVVNFVLFMLIAVGQFVIYQSVTANTLVTDSARKSKDQTIARRLLTVVVSDFLCWFPIGVLGLMAVLGFPVPGEVNVGMAIFVLPLNSALNPLLYTFNMLAEKRRKAKEARLFKWLETNSLRQTTESEESNAPRDGHPRAPEARQHMFQCLEQWLAQDGKNKEIIVSILDNLPKPT